MTKLQLGQRGSPPSIDLDAVRTFITIVDLGLFHEAASFLSISQQAVSKRVACLEKRLGVQLFARTGRSVQVTIDGQAFIPHARNLIEAVQRAINSVQPGRRALRVDVINPRIAPAHLLHNFHRTEPSIELDVVTSLFDLGAALLAVASGKLDASIRAINVRSGGLPNGIECARVYDEPIQLLVGPRHKLAQRAEVSPSELSKHKIWMPSLPAGTEWTAFYDDFAAAFGFTIDKIGPNFGVDSLLETIMSSSQLVTFVGEQTRMVWPPEYDLRRISLSQPTPVYPHSLLWHRDNLHPSLNKLRSFFGDRSISARPKGQRTDSTWQPAW